jgi:hypothetical protein
MAAQKETLASFVAPWVALIASSFAFRFPALLNASATNSDAAIVGIQAMHILDGDRGVFLLGSGYQTSSDSFVAAGFFWAMGPTPLALMLSALSLHVLLTLLAYATLRRHMSAWAAFVPTLALVFTTSCLHSFALYPPRQLSLTLAMAAIWVLDSARHGVRFAIGCLLVMLAWTSDPYAIVMVFGVALLAGLYAWESDSRAGAAIGCGVGLVLGAIPLAIVWYHPNAHHGITDTGFDVIGHNWQLLVSSCFPWMSGTTIYAPVHWMDYAPIEENFVLHGFQVASVAIACGAVIYGGFTIAARKELVTLRRLDAMALVTIGATLAGFLVSHMVMDQFSMRYLAAIVLVLPFAFAPLVNRLGPKRGALVLAPYLLTAAIGGWLGYGPYVSGPLPVLTDSGRAEDERTLIAELDVRECTDAVADYWAAYRLTFLARERVRFVPLHVQQDRYSPYRVQFESAKRVAYVFDEKRSFEDRLSTEKEFVAMGTFLPQVEHVDVGVFHATIFTRK